MSRFSSDEPILLCPDCGSVLSFAYNLEKGEARITRSFFTDRRYDIWRYRELIPVREHNNFISMGEGWTPLVKSSHFKGELGVDIQFKLESLNPTGSFKDRGNSVMVSRLNELNIGEIADDSSGNAGSSLAAYSARAKLKCRIYVPQHASPGKLSQIRMYGALLKPISGSRAYVTERIKEDCRKQSGPYYASHNVNPLFIEGTKTMAFEICEQSDWTPPDHIIFPVGGGGLIVGSYKGFREFYDLGLVDEFPAHHAVQSVACSPVVRAFESGIDYIPEIEIKETVAEGIHIPKPERGKRILRAIRDSGGEAISVSEEDILSCYRNISRYEGIFCEPTSAASLAGLFKLVKCGKIVDGDSVILSLTGSGLKDIGTADLVLKDSFTQTE